MLGASVVQVLVPPCCLYNPSASTTSMHGPSDPPPHPCARATPVSPVPTQPVSKARHLSWQCAPTAAPGTCTRCGARPAAWLRPPSASSPPNWCWCWVSDPPRWGQPPLSPPTGGGHLQAGSATPRAGTGRCAGRGHMALMALSCPQCTSTTWASCTETSRWVAAGLGGWRMGWGGL